jgi:hypothetical protein
MGLMHHRFREVYIETSFDFYQTTTPDPFSLLCFGCVVMIDFVQD